MGSGQDQGLELALARSAHRLTGGPDSLDFLLERVGDARFVLIGEATHGTHEFYRLRGELTKRLIDELGFGAVAIEGDWPDCWRVDRFVRGRGDAVSARDALAGFERFPAWMWQNLEVLDFVRWLRAYNEHRLGEGAVRFLGLDLYALHAAMQVVLTFLDRTDPEAAARARRRYGCFEQFGWDPEAYGREVSWGLTPDCESQAREQLFEMMEQQAAATAREDDEDRFGAEQSARMVQSAEAYYRAMFAGPASTWNLRDEHMAETLEAIATHLGGSEARVVVWAHNTHVGDARATEMADQGEINLGQRVRERHPRESLLIGMSTYEGTVSAASSWGGVVERKRVRPALEGSCEQILHGVGLPAFGIDLRALGEQARALRERQLSRAIGVVYRSESERVSHYMQVRLSKQFDVMLHVDRTRALEPLAVTSTWERGELPETYPMGV